MRIADGLALLFGPGAWPAFASGPRKGRASLNGAGMPLFLHGRGDFSFDVVASARQRTDLRTFAATRHWATGDRHECVATLILTDGKAYEKNRVAVEIDGVMVGYCPSYLATQFREWMQRWHFSDAIVRCKARLVRDAVGADGESLRLRVKLDIELPFKVTRL
jgi:hypothetical protein